MLSILLIPLLDVNVSVLCLFSFDILFTFIFAIGKLNPIIFSIPEDFFSLEKVGLTAGASTPDDVIDEVEKTLSNSF